MDPNLLALLIAAGLVLVAFTVREVRVAVRRALKRAYERGRHAGAQSLRALEMLLAQPEQPTKDVLIERGDTSFTVSVRAVTDSEMGFLRRTPQGMQQWELVSMALVQPDLTSNEVRQLLLPGEVAQLADLIMEFSGYGDVPA